MSIHPNFGDWYRPATVGASETVLTDRWEGVEEVSKELNPDQLISLAKLFVLPNATELMVPEHFRDKFRAHDDFFPSKGSLQELRVLAGIVIRLAIERDHPLAAVAALALVCGSFGSREALLPERDHLDFAQRYLVNVSRQTRSSVDLPSISVPSFSRETFSEALNPTWFQVNQTPNLREPLINTFDEIVSKLSFSLDQAEKAIEQLYRTARIREEEVGILWWLQTQFSRDLQRSFSDLGYASGAIVFAKELADLTVFVPGSDVAVAVLIHALALAGAPASSETLNIANATNDTPRDWRERVCKEDKIKSTGLLSPVLLAMHKSLETDGRDDWLPVYRKACDIPADKPFPLIQVSLQFYRERMLLRALSEATP